MAKNTVETLTAKQRERVRDALINEIKTITKQYPQIEPMLLDKGLNLEMGLGLMNMFLTNALEKV